MRVSMRKLSFSSVLSLTTFTFVLSSTVLLMVPAPAKANGFTDAFNNFGNRFNNNSHNQNGNNGQGDKNNNKGKDKKYCQEHSNDFKCRPASVPEFGLIPGIVTAVGSAGTYLALRKRV